MAWLARSIANSFGLDDDAAAEAEENNPKSDLQDEQQDTQIGSQSSTPSSSTTTSKGVKEDLSEITKSISKQFWGVASFLAPSPEPLFSDSDRPQLSDWRYLRESSGEEDVSDEAVIAGIKDDFAEIGEKFRTGISKWSNNIGVSEISKIASSFLQFGSDGEGIENGVVGVTEDVLMFSSNIAMYPKTWLDFPVPDGDDFDDFDISYAQQEHALTVERLVPSLAALRMELCPRYMTDNCFWKIYFVLVHPKLNTSDAELLSTPQIVEARAVLMQEQQTQGNRNPEPDSGVNASSAKESRDSPHEEYISEPPVVQSKSVPFETSSSEAAFEAFVDEETEKHSIQSTKIHTIDKTIVEPEIHNSVSESSHIGWDEKYEDDADDWLNEESSDTETVGVSITTKTPLVNDEDVSFTDLEEDEEDDEPSTFRKSTYGSDSSGKDM